MLAAFAVIPIEWQPLPTYEHCRREAEQLIGDRDPDDWPTVALALSTSHPIWTQDKDFAVTGLTAWTTGALLDMLGARHP